MFPDFFVFQSVSKIRVNSVYRSNERFENLSARTVEKWSNNQ
jgi:hypothetical protein